MGQGPCEYSVAPLDRRDWGTGVCDTPVQQDLSQNKPSEGQGDRRSDGNG